MWFKQARLFKFEDKFSFSTTELEEQLAPLCFTPCLPHMSSSQGWITPAEEQEIPEESSLVYAIPGFLLICLQNEEKLLPATIVRQKLNERVKDLQTEQNKKISYKEKNLLKQGIYNELLPKAFGKLTRTYALIDTKNNWLILNTNNAKRVEKFTSFLSRTLNTKIISPETKKISPILTNWLLNNKCPSSLQINDTCMLQDPKQKQRNGRIQGQDLSASYVQNLLKNNFEISQIKMTWNDQVTFVLKDDFTLQSLQYQDSVTELSAEDNKEAASEKSFRVDFFLMSNLLTKMFQEFLKIFEKTSDKKSVSN